MQIYFVHNSLSQSVEVRYEVNTTKDQEFHCVLIIIIKLETYKNNIRQGIRYERVKFRDKKW